jgi:hypothetical protein
MQRICSISIVLVLGLACVGCGDSSESSEAGARIAELEAENERLREAVSSTETMPIQSKNSPETTPSESETTATPRSTTVLETTTVPVELPDILLRDVSELRDCGWSHAEIATRHDFDRDLISDPITRYARSRIRVTQDLLRWAMGEENWVDDALREFEVECEEALKVLDRYGYERSLLGGAITRTLDGARSNRSLIEAGDSDWTWACLDGGWKDPPRKTCVFESQMTPVLAAWQAGETLAIEAIGLLRRSK